MTLSSPAQELVDPLDHGNMEALVHGRHGSPFDILGPHTGIVGGRPVWIIRAFLPGASSAWVVLPAGSEQPDAQPHAAIRREMTLLHPAGLFSLVSAGETAPAYRLAAQRGDDTTELIEDPYAFPPMLSAFDLHLIGEGKHLQIYDRLGAHVREMNGVRGVFFAVWAPNARRVSVVGDFNRWDERVNPMRLRSSGVWELFIPDLAAGALYKYAVLSGNHAYHVLKADPLAFAAEVRPGTASRVWDLAGYAWGDDDWMRERAARGVEHSPMSVYEVHAG